MGTSHGTAALEAKVQVWKNEGVATSLGALNLMSATLNGDMLDFGGHDAMSDNTFIDISAFDADFNRMNYEATDEKIAKTDGFISQNGEDAATRKATYEESIGWYAGITSDMFG